MSVDFNEYANDYRNVINNVSSITGEQFEYFIGLRTGLMKAMVEQKLSDKKTLKVLDFGCGIGATEIFLKECFPNAQIIGIDTSSESIKVANGLQLDNVSFNLLESSKLPYEDNYFDLIYSNGTFHHIDEKKHIITLNELSRVLTHGGDMFIFENNPYNPLMVRSMKNNPFDRDAKVVSSGYMKKNIEHVGFQFNAVNYYFFFPRWLKFLRFTEKYLKWLPVGAQYFVWGTK